MSESRLEYLFNCYIYNNYTSAEEEELMSLVSQPENKTIVQKLIENLIENTGSEIEMRDDAAASILQNILQANKAPVIPIRNRKTVFSFWMRVAAATILFVSAATYFLIDKKDSAGAKVTPVAQNSPHILPGRDRAVLITSEGKTIMLDSVQNGVIAHQGNNKISKQGGLLIYNVPPFAKPEASVTYNTIVTPRGAQFQVILSDGSKVWLNSASSLRFPVGFADSQRTVELNGEAYFEVVKNKEKPFLVKVGDMQVKVLGTHFNIKAYNDESFIKTSLFEGSVKITRGEASGFLKPGEQALLNSSDNNIQISKANMDEAIAWKNGLFEFDGADITSIMKEIARWYDAEIVYTGKPPMRRFEGKISRNAQLSDVLRILELSSVKFTVTGNKIIIQ
jgi:hypothetical protein